MKIACLENTILGALGFLLTQPDSRENETLATEKGTNLRRANLRQSGLAIPPGERERRLPFPGRQRERGHLSDPL